jgi:hypothetical protein
VKAQIAEFGLAEVVEEIMPYGSLMAGEVPTPELLDKFGIKDVPAMHYGHSFEDPAATDSITEHERLAYGSGDCHLLSVAMHRQTGWEMLAVIAGLSPSEGGDEDGMSLAHCFAVEGDLLWDVNGVRHWDDVMVELDELYGDDFELVQCADEVALDELVGLEDADAAIDAALPVAVRLFEAHDNASRLRR